RRRLPCLSRLVRFLRSVPRVGPRRGGAISRTPATGRASAPPTAALPGALGVFARAAPPLAVGRLLPRDRLHPGPDPRIAAGDTEQALAGLVDDLVLQLLFHDSQPIERELLRILDRARRDLDPIHTSALSLPLLAAAVRLSARRAGAR